MIDNIESVINTIRHRRSMGQTLEEIHSDLTMIHSDQIIFLAYVAAKMADEA